MLTEAQYTEMKARMDRRDSFMRAYCAEHKTNGIPSSAFPADCQITNEETSQIELYQWVNDPPDTYFCYVQRDPDPARLNGHKVTTFMGDILGKAAIGSAYRSNFGDMRRSIRVWDTGNGKTYYGTYFESSGDYCRLKANKA